MEKSFNEKQLKKTQKRVEAITGFYRHLAVYGIVNFIVLVIKWFNMSDSSGFFTFCTFNLAFWWGVTIVFHALGVISESLSPGRKWEERKIQEHMEKQGHRSKWE